MVVQDKEKNKAYVAKYRAIKKSNEEVKKEYNSLNATYLAEHQKKVKETIGIEEYRKKKAEEMRIYRAKAKQSKQETTGSFATTIQSAFRNKLARNTLLNLKQENANEVLSQINNVKKAKDAYDLKTKLSSTIVVNDLLNNLFPTVLNAIPENKKRGRPRKPRNPVGRPFGSKNKPKN